MSLFLLSGVSKARFDRGEKENWMKKKNEKAVLRFDLRSSVLDLLTFALISSYVSEITLWTYKRHFFFFFCQMRSVGSRWRLRRFRSELFSQYPFFLHAAGLCGLTGLPMKSKGNCKYPLGIKAGLLCLSIWILKEHLLPPMNIQPSKPSASIKQADMSCCCCHVLLHVHLERYVQKCLLQL